MAGEALATPVKEASWLGLGAYRTECGRDCTQPRVVWETGCNRDQIRSGLHPVEVRAAFEPPEPAEPAVERAHVRDVAAAWPKSALSSAQKPAQSVSKRHQPSRSTRQRPSSNPLWRRWSVSRCACEEW